jgi:prevent-host-death family protein
MESIRSTWRSLVARNISLAEAKAKLSECIREAERGEPVMITRYGKPVAALVGAEELERLDRLRAAGPGAGLAGLAGGWEGSEELADAVERRVRDRRSRQDD